MRRARAFLSSFVSLLLVQFYPAHAYRTAQLTSFADFSSLLANRELFPDNSTPVIVAVALSQYSWQTLKQQLETLAPANTTILFLKCTDDVSVPGGLRGIRNVRGSISLMPATRRLSAPPATIICTAAKDHPHQRFMVAFEDLLASSAKSNILLLSHHHSPGIARSVALVALQYSSRLDRVAFATDRDGVVSQVYVIDIKTGQRVQFQRSRLHSVFQGIYDRKVWSSEGLGSGVGSSLQFTKKLRDQLPALLVEYGVKTMVDAPCGAMLWMPLVLEEVTKKISGFRYFGLDVSCGVIQDVQKRLGPRPNWQFKCQDVTESDFPVEAPDLVFSRDALQHLSYDMIDNFLKNVKRQKAKYLLVGSYLDVDSGNRNIQPGDYFDINLLKPPFNLRPAPVLTLKEEATPPQFPDPQKYMILVDVEKMEWDTP